MSLFWIPKLFFNIVCASYNHFPKQNISTTSIFHSSRPWINDFNRPAFSLCAPLASFNYNTWPSQRGCSARQCSWRTESCSKSGLVRACYSSKNSSMDQGFCGQGSSVSYSQPDGPQGLGSLWPLVRLVDCSSTL